MSELVVKKIYDQLYTLESKVKRGDVYPIHKRLVFEEEAYDDIYGWISKKIKFDDGDKVLDAGCGVGFGSCILGKEHFIEVKGISLSDKEVSTANSYAIKVGLEDRVKFEKQSFDSLTGETYNKIIAVESIKHSLNLSFTLGVLVKALKPGGTLYLVEDFYTQRGLTADAKNYNDDWNLVDVFRLEDYYQGLENGKTVFHDLTQYIPSKRRILINIKLAFHHIGNIFRKDNEMNVHKIFRGGYYLDRLYVDGLMKYGLLAYTKGKN